ncbi:uncharacterized protein LOC113334919 [Papaver somniferum]|uniref:uncharacterized protein LOC113334919 n=1 Tax=Papaver somniferum TaxID=3469 RepID=UPI000E6FCC11|nr:uncharacterized protein LOC113334919 [Papaver somniferum]
MRDRVSHDAKMMNDYFTPGTGYTSRQFKQRLGMREDLFEKLLGKLLEVDPEWKQRPDATGTTGHSPYMKLVVVMKCLCKSTEADNVDDYTRMGATTIYKYVKRFCHTVCMTFGERYLREPTPEDVERLLAENEDRGFLGMFGSVDCMQFPWKNFLVSWQGTYRGKDKESSLGVTPPCNYVINGHHYNMGYFLADGIYPKLITIVQAFSQTLDIPNYVRFNKYQMSKRKDIERAFGVFQGIFIIFGSPCKYWKQYDLNPIMKCCLILHNMIIEHERRDPDWGRVVPVPILEPTNNGRVSMSSLKNLEMHLQLRNDLVKDIILRPGRGGQAGDLSSLEGSDMEYVVLPSSGGHYDDTDLEEEVVPSQNEDGTFDYYGDYNDQIPNDFEHAVEHVYADGHVGDEYEHDDEDSGNGEDYDDDEDDDDNEDDSDDDDDAPYNDAGMYDDDDVEA